MCLLSNVASTLLFHFTDFARKSSRVDESDGSNITWDGRLCAPQAVSEKGRDTFAQDGHIGTLVGAVLQCG